MSDLTKIKALIKKQVIFEVNKLEERKQAMR